MINKVFRNLLTTANINPKMHNFKTILFKGCSTFAKKETKKGKSYNLSGIDEKKLPAHLKKAYQAKK